MAPKCVAPAINLKSFSCPHCGAFANQDWFTVNAKVTEKNQPPKL